MDYVWIRSIVEYPGGEEQAFRCVERSKWEARTEKEQELLRAEMAVEHQNSVASCGASEVDPDEVPDYYLSDPADWTFT